jgi:hypothetical protein
MRDLLPQRLKIEGLAIADWLSQDNLSTEHTLIAAAQMCKLV